MTEKELELCRCKYVIINNEKEKYLTLQEELKELQNEPSVKRYLELLDLIDASKESFSKYNMVRYAFNDVIGNSETDCNAYVYLMTYYSHKGIKYIQDSRTPVLNPLFYCDLYSEYMNVETGKIKHIRFRDRDEFEKNSLVVLPPLDSENIDFTRFAENIHIWYLEALINQSQDVVMRKLVNPETTKRFFE